MRSGSAAPDEDILGVEELDQLLSFKGKQVIIRTLTPKNKPSFSGGFNVIFLYKALLAILWTRAEADPVLPLLEMVPSGAAVPVHM